MITIVFTDFVGPLHPDEIERQKEEMFYPYVDIPDLTKRQAE